MKEQMSKAREGDDQQASGPPFELVLDGSTLSVALLHRFLDSREARVALVPDVEARVRAASDQLAVCVRSGMPIYGGTRGLGPLKDEVLTESEECEFQKRILLSHATGFGETFADEIVQLAMLIRANAVCRGNFGTRPELIVRFVDLLNAGVIPQMPVYGSLGSGDLQPMAALGLVLTGDQHGVAKWRGRTGPAPEILAAAGLEPTFQLGPEEALSIISGSTVLAAGTVYALRRIRRQITLLDGAYALTLEAIRGEVEALDERTHAARGIPGQIEAARAMRCLLEGSRWTTDEGRRRLGELMPRLQDAVSLRSSPHIHGALREMVAFATTALDREVNAATLNPLMFRRPDDSGRFDVVMGGNYDGSYLAHLLDYLNIAITDCAGLSTSRSERLISPRASHGLPANLVGSRPGLNSGLVQVQSLQISIHGQMRQQAGPASINSRSAKDMQEDHNSMGNSALYDVLLNIERFDTILAVEFLLAAQAIDLIRPRMHGLPLGRGSAAVLELIRAHVDPPGDDRFFRDDVLRVIELVQDLALMNLIRSFTGGSGDIGQTVGEIDEWCATTVTEP
jgi:histidine ammonia-lyase